MRDAYRAGAHPHLPPQRLYRREYLRRADRAAVQPASGSNFAPFEQLNDDYTKANLNSLLWFALFFPVVNLVGACAVARDRVVRRRPGSCSMR